MPTVAMRHARAITVRGMPVAVAVYLAVAGFYARPGLLGMHSRAVTLLGFGLAAVALLIRAMFPTERTILGSTVVVLAVLLARAWIIGVDGLEYRTGDRVVGVAAWLAWAYVAVHMGLTGIASLALEGHPNRRGN